MSKGSKQRPTVVTEQLATKRWDLAFPKEKDGNK